MNTTFKILHVGCAVILFICVCADLIARNFGWAGVLAILFLANAWALAGIYAGEDLHRLYRKFKH